MLSSTRILWRCGMLKRLARVVLAFVLIVHSLIHHRIIPGGLLGPMDEQDGRANTGCWIISWMHLSSGPLA